MIVINISFKELRFIISTNEKAFFFSSYPTINSELNNKSRNHNNESCCEKNSLIYNFFYKNRIITVVIIYL